MRSIVFSLFLLSTLVPVHASELNKMPAELVDLYSALADYSGKPILEDIDTDPMAPDADFVDIGGLLDEAPANLLHEASSCGGTIYVNFYQSSTRQSLTAQCESGKYILKGVIASGGASGRRTPYGRFTVYTRMRQAWSGAYNVAMPNALFFSGCGANRPNCIAIHGSSTVTGRGASKGCVRLRFGDARKLFNAAKGNRVVVTVQ